MSAYQDMILCPKRAVRRMCAEAFGIEEHRIVGASRLREIVVARHATCFVLRKRFPEMSYPWLGRFMGGRDHSTVINAVRQHEARAARDPALRQVVAALVKGRLPMDHDSHVMRWRAQLRDLSRWYGEPCVLGTDEGLDAVEGELAEFADPEKRFCVQCDRAVKESEAARCSSRLCSLRGVRLKALVA